MMKRILGWLLAAALALPLAGCGQRQQTSEPGERVVVAATYPIYLFASALCAGAQEIRVERLDTGSGSCLHDYTLSMADMRKLEGADLIALNGAGLEEFMADALAASSAGVVDCSEGVALLESLSHHHEEEGGEEGHDHGHWDPHYWMDPANAQAMVSALEEGLVRLSPEQEEVFRSNGDQARELLERELAQKWTPPGCRELITFHDGFQYFARAFDLELLAAIEEEAGSEASAKEIVEISRLVEQRDIPAIFAEVNGSDATALAIGRETGCQVYDLDMLMGGEDLPGGMSAAQIVEQYVLRMRQDLDTVMEALG